MALLGYRQTPTIRRSSRPRMERTKPKARNKKTKTPHGFDPKEMTNSTQVLDKTIDALQNLGNQKFALPPFDEHFEHWFQTLQTILSDLGSNPTATLDDQFLEERNKVLSDTESALKESRMREASSRETIVARLDAENRLLQMEREHQTDSKQLAAQEKEAVEPLAERIGSLKEQLQSITRIKAGFLRGISKEEKSRRESEAKLRLDAAENELKKLTQSFQDRRMALGNKHEEKENEILAKMNQQQKEAESLAASSEVDMTAEARRIACSTLITAIRALGERNIRT